MPGNEEIDPHVERRKDPEGVHTETWKRVLEQMDAIADDRRDDGWEVLTIMAGHTNTVGRDGDESKKFGLCHIVPNKKAEAFEDFYDEETFTEYLAYGTSVGVFMYVVTELIDPTNDRSVLIASRYDMSYAKAMIQDAEREGVLYTHVQTLDGTVIGSFEHEEYAPLITKPGA
ncbi:DUF7529 family protein [Halovivax gelatinilyticus]|uniref:DUF7529 family protein n=1 Tax=Halovivax gelatinilyticus TaxID=2961597 RepID=UPI0020CA593B|nr:hypothetical protein [Halovivax gelatinilyticus]